MFPIRDHNPSGRFAFVTLALILANLAVFLAYYPGSSDYAQAQIYYDWGLIPARLLAGEGYETLFTHMFLHGGWMHLAGNLLFLWIFGDNLEEQMGHFGFLLFYLLAGLAAAFVQILPDPYAMVPMVGASGAIAGVLGGYLLLFPKARVDVLFIFIIFFRIFALPAYVVLAVWFGIQLFASLSGAEDGVAYWAHAGGFIAGLIFTLPVWLRRGGPRFWRRTDGQPPHAAADYALQKSVIPKVGRRRS